MNLTLPLPPSTNHSHHEISTKNGRRMRIPSKATKEWTRFARDVAVEQCKAQEWAYVTGEKVIVRYTVFWPDKRRRDCHNLMKVCLDALEGIVYDDDKWVLPRAIDFLYDKHDPRLEIEVMRF
jgi:crossover junction endodeoxyribonuclease RusA